MDKKYDLLSMGEVMLRLSPPVNERLCRGDILTKQAAGAELNVAAGVSCLGLKTGTITKVPDNAVGYFIQNKMKEVGVSDEYLIFDRAKDARLGIYYYENGAAPRKPSVVYDRLHSSVRTFSLAELPEEVYASTRCFHTSGITLALGGELRENAIEAVRRFKKAGALISFDVNFRANLWGSEEAKATVERILPYVDIFFCASLTARLTFLKQGTPKEMMKQFTKEYPIKVVASTDRVVHSPLKHTFGSVIYDAATDTYFEEEPYRDIDVVDRVGSGDAYVAGALYGYLAHGGDCRRALEYGNAYSAIKCTVPGDLPCSGIGETDSIIAAHKAGGGSEMNR